MRSRSLTALLLSCAACGSSPSSTNGAGQQPDPSPPSTVTDAGVTPAACTSTAAKLYATSAPLLALAADAANLYVTERGATGDSIWRIPKSGAVPAAIATDVAKKDESQVQAIAVDAGFVYWATIGTGATTTGSIGRVPTTGGAPTTLASDRPINFYGNIAVANGNVYWTEAALSASPTGDIAFVPVAGGDVSTIATGAENRVPEQLAVGGGYLHFTIAGDDNNLSSIGKKLMRVPLGGGAAQEVADMGLGDALATNATSILFTAGDKEAVLPFAESAPTALLDFVDVTAVAADDRAAYVIDGASIVKRASLDGSAPPKELTPAADARLLGIAIDDKCVYWTKLEEGVFMQAKE